MHPSFLLILLPTTALASYCPRDFVLNATMAEGPCSRAAHSTTTLISSMLQPTPLARIPISNDTGLDKGDFRLWNDKAFDLEVVPVSKMHGAISLAGKMDLGFYAPVCSGAGVCGRKTF